ncbi:MAG TPA: VWA domain-containing protein [Acidobacteriaceae bacterium]|jgi:VWFA-related protein|nr:VWA domain-containing protein [Acidobacteriaceae bacterium]
MRNAAILLVVLALVVLAAGSLTVFGATPITVEQLQQTFSEAQARHLSDYETARKLAGVELTSQLRAPVLQQLVASSPGPRTAQALRGLADASLFLDPPASEIPSRPTPDFATQKMFLARTIHYVARTLPTLPDFTGTRVTDHIDDTPQALQRGGWPEHLGLHLAGSVEVPISFMDGAERDAFYAAAASPTLKKVNATKQKGAAKAPATNSVPMISGLNSWGEFRTLLGIVLVDAQKGKMSWARWEQIGDTQAAVFQFQVDRSVSHYDIQFARSHPAANKHQSSSNYLFRSTTSYHGIIAIDPTTGAVRRVLIDADPEPGSPIHRASMLVEYGPVQMGSRTFICPVQSISVSASDEVYQFSPQSPFQDLVELQINETRFTGYHRFGSESTVNNSPAPDTNPESIASASPTPSVAAAQPGNAASTQEQPSAAAALVAESAPPPPPEPVVAPITPAEEKADQEILIQAIESLPGEPSNSESGDETAGNSSDASNLTLKSTTRLVDIGLVAYDKHGKPVTDLRQEQIEVYDNGRRQQLQGFRHATPSAAESTSPAPQSPDTFTNATPVIREAQDAPDLLILLLDESHLAFLDLTRAREEMLRFLKATRPTSRIAIYAIGEHGFRAIQDVTQDHALATQKLTAWYPNIQSVSRAQEDDTRLRQQFDTVHNVVDLNSVNGNYTEIPDSVFSTDPVLRQMGQSPLRDVLDILMILSRHFSAVPGHKSMAWISGDSALSYWEDRAVGLDKSATFPDAGLQHAREALNDAHIALYIVDASALEGGGVDASLANQFIKLDQVGQDKAALGLEGPPPAQSRQDAGRAMAQLQTDLHGIQGPVRQLAESTGGRAINKGSDLKATLDGIVDDTDSGYALAFRPDIQADSKYHAITLKVPSRKDVKLTYRNGYFYGEPSSSTRELFHQAIWSPQDVGDVALVAHAVKTTEGNTIELRIAFASLALKPQVPGQAGEGQSIQAQSSESQSKSAANRWTDQLYIFIAQRDDATQKAEVTGDTLRLSLKQETYASGMPDGIPYTHPIEVKSKLGSVRILVVDGNSGKIGSVTLPSSALQP